MGQARFTFWRNKKQWSIRELAFLLHGLEPYEPPDEWGWLIRQEDTEDFEVWQFANELVDLANADPEISGLIGESQFSIYTDDRIDSVLLLNWASSLEGIDVPPELQRLLNQVHKKTGTRYWMYEHDTKLLNKCRWVIEQYWERKDRKKAPSKIAILKELEDDHGLSAREAEAVDLVTRHDLRRNRKK